LDLNSVVFPLLGRAVELSAKTNVESAVIKVVSAVMNHERLTITVAVITSSCGPIAMIVPTPSIEGTQGISAPDAVIKTCVSPVTDGNLFSSI
jgi:hypothetical protein